MKQSYNRIFKFIFSAKYGVSCGHTYWCPLSCKFHEHICVNSATEFCKQIMVN